MLVTQNVDGLSQRALDHALSSAEPADRQDPGQPRLLEMHGRLFDVRCTSRRCRHVEYNTNSPICAALRGTEDIVGAGQEDAEPQIPEKDLPSCTKCGAIARPGVVWFGEQPQYLDEIDDLVGKADLCLVVGTSSTVSMRDITGKNIDGRGLTRIDKGLPGRWVCGHGARQWRESSRLQP